MGFVEDVIVPTQNYNDYTTLCELKQAFEIYNDNSFFFTTLDLKKFLRKKGLISSIYKGKTVWRGIKINWLKLNDRDLELDFKLI